MKADLTLLLLGTLFQRIPLVSRFRDSVAKRIREKYRKVVSLGKVKLRFGTLEMTGLRVIDHEKFYFVAIERLVIKVEIGIGSWSVKEIDVDGLAIRRLPKERAADSRNPANNNAPLQQRIRQLYTSLYRRIDRFLKRSPNVLRFTNITVALDADEGKSVSLNNVTLLREGGDANVVIFFDHPEMIVRKNESQPALMVRSDFMHVKLNYAANNSGGVAYSSVLKTGKLRLTCHYIIDGKELSVDPIYFNIKGMLDGSGLDVDRSSRFNFNKLNFTFLFNHAFFDTDTVELGLTLQYCKMTDFLSSFPDFVRREIYTVSFAGGFGFEALLHFKISNPENYSFKVNVTKDVSTGDMGELNFDFLKGAFDHCIRRTGKLTRDVTLSRQNPDFTPIENVSPHLLKTIVCNEDWNYYQHEGIDIKNMGLALVSNIKLRRFARGASTITMQLVRNLFLDHNKTIYRKVEELFLTWLLECVFCVGKRRQLEIYLNIIEFGPNIYGVSEASKYYFAKDPRDLTLTESLVLSYILPRPTLFHNSLLKKSPKMFDDLAEHVKTLSRLMALKGCIDYEQFKGISPEIKFGNGLGTVPLAERIDNLDPYLMGIYANASKIWTERYRYLPQPFISCPPHSHDEQTRLHNQERRGAGHAFDVAFKDFCNRPDGTEELFVRFADLVSELDVEDKIFWGGNLASTKDLPHFEIKNWKELN